MKKVKCLFLFLMLFLLPFNAEAIYCDSDDKVRLKNIISNINISYDYQIINNEAIFSIKFNNLNPQLYFKDPNGNVYTSYGLENNELVLNNYADGQSYAFTFYGTDDCLNDEVGILYATLPKYNPYFELNVCDNAKEYKLCQKWASHSLSRKQFVDKVNEYKKSVGKLDDSEINKQISIIDLTMSFIKMYGLYIAIAIAIIIITVKIIKYKKDSFGF